MPPAVAIHPLDGWTGPRDTALYTHEIATSWFDLSYEIVASERWFPPPASRFWGYAGVTLYESVRPGMPGYRSLAGQVNGLDQATFPRATQEYHWPTVANAALHALFLGFFTHPNSVVLIETLYQQHADEYNDTVPEGMFQLSEDYGVRVAEAILAWAASDGYSEFNNCAYTPPVGEGLWVPTPPAYLPALQPCWGQIRTCVVDGGPNCDPGLHPPYSEDPNSDFYAEAWEVYQVSSNLTQEQIDTVYYWADGGAGTATPGGHWTSILGGLLIEQDRDLAMAAEAYARLGLAEMDAFICCWFTKFEFNLLRPITYIRNLWDPAWFSPIVTPPFPEYTSGHSTVSGACAQVLTDLFGYIQFTDHTHDALGIPPRTYSNFWEAAQEAAISRLYGGIHFMSAIENGVEQGRCIGEQVSALVFEWSPSREQPIDVNIP